MLEPKSPTLCQDDGRAGITAPLGSRITPFTEAVETWALAEPAGAGEEH